MNRKALAAIAVFTLIATTSIIIASCGASTKAGSNKVTIKGAGQ